MSVLTRDEAQNRAARIGLRRYTIDLDLTRGAEVFGSTTSVRLCVLEAGTDTFIELEAAALHRIALDGNELDPTLYADGRYPLTGLGEGEHEVLVEADMHYSRTGEGMHRFTDPADGETYLYTMCCMSDAPKVFACFDQPDLKAVFEVTVTAPPEWTVLGNGVATRVGDTADGRWQLAPTQPISTYLMAVAAGPWHSVRTRHAGLPFGLHVRRSLGAYLDADADELFDITRRCFDRYHEIFDEPYPFDSYDQAFVPEFNSGAMENPGLVTFRDQFVFRSAVTEGERQSRAMVIAHEMAHMWFGDLVTMRWWDDIWLNESFAEYMGFQILTEATGYTDTWADFGVRRKSWGYDADQRPSTHPVAPEPDGVPDTAAARLNFDGISYAKGASALRQLVAWLGEQHFFAGINDHFTLHRFGNATLADFIDALARASGRPVPEWADAWLRTTGVDTLTPQISEGPDGWELRLLHEGSRPHQLTIGCYDLDADTGRLVPRTPLRWNVPEDETHTAAGRRPDLVLVNDGDYSYVKIGFDERSWQTIAAALSGLPDALSRAVVWNAARDLVRDGKLAPTDYLDVLRAHLPQESDVVIVQGVLAFARGQIADRYLPAEQRPAALATLVDTCRELLARTADGSAPGLRLTAVQTLADSTADPAELGDWLAAGAVPGGPELDPELRWRLLLRRSVLGAVTLADIEEELARDSSATGQEGAARCRAALPDVAAKEAAWAELFDKDDLSTYLATATAEGFWQPEQHELLRAYLARYFPAVADLAARRGPAIAQAVGRFGFPHHAVDERTLRLGEDCLREANPIPALRRRFADELDDLRRALRVRAAQATATPATSG
ncbi:aminopeptidase N [Streptomyces buecherae]|uniref:aminopeptidase N n=1 Tax=Streptomyces buecherae TaxID=2763006 RepID=UPI0037B0264D